MIKGTLSVGELVISVLQIANQRMSLLYCCKTRGPTVYIVCMDWRFCLMVLYCHGFCTLFRYSLVTHQIVTKDVSTASSQKLSGGV